MSYQKDLDEMTDRVLQDELQRRQELRSYGRCSYCRQFLATSQAGTLAGCKLHEWKDETIGKVKGPLLS